MSTQQSVVLGNRENWWGEKPIEELRETEVSNLTVTELRKLIRETTKFNISVDLMSESELREWVRDRRLNPDRPNECVTDFERARSKAHRVLRERAEPVSTVAKYFPPCLPGGRRQQLCAWLFDGETLDHDPLAMHSERSEVDLTDPELHVARDHEHEHGTEEYGQHRFRRRFDPENGYIGGVSFRDLPIGEFLDIVEDVLLDLKSRYAFRESKVDGWMGDARELKKQQDQSDQDVLTQVLYRVFRSADN